MITLSTNANTWDAFMGACSFADGAEPLFAEIRVDGCPQALDPDWPAMVLVLDEQDGVTVLTVNGLTVEAYPIVYRRPLYGMDRFSAQRWAAEQLDPDVTHRDLLLCGFEYSA